MFIAVTIVEYFALIIAKEIIMAQRVAGDLYESITGQIFEIGRQLRQPNGYPFDPVLLKKYLQGAIEGCFQISTAENEVKPVAEIDPTLFDSSTYFVNRDGLYIWPKFSSRILPAYTAKITKRGVDGIGSIDLKRNMYDRKIITEFFGNEEEARKNAFTPDQIAELIDKQKDGVSGLLLVNGYTNIFYVVGKDQVLFAVGVFWRSGARKWDVGAYALDGGGGWCAGSHIFRNKR